MFAWKTGTFDVLAYHRVGIAEEVDGRADENHIGNEPRGQRENHHTKNPRMQSITRSKSRKYRKNIVIRVVRCNRYMRDVWPQLTVGTRRIPCLMITRARSLIVSRRKNLRRYRYWIFLR